MPQVQIIAHRGPSGVYPEHTLPAFEAAIVEGVDALECDVRLTRDGTLVCVHDRRVNRTSDGRGVVSALELADLAELDFASWRRPERSGVSTLEEPDLDAGRVLTLDRLLQPVVDAERPVQLQVETKHPTLARYGLAAPASREASRVSVLSYARTSLRRMHGLAPRLPGRASAASAPATPRSFSAWM